MASHKAIVAMMAASTAVITALYIILAASVVAVHDTSDGRSNRRNRSRVFAICNSHFDVADANPCYN